MANCPCCGHILGEPPRYHFRIEYRRCSQKSCACHLPGGPQHGPFLFAQYYEHRKQQRLFLGKLRPCEIEAWQRGALTPLDVAMNMAGVKVPDEIW